MGIELPFWSMSRDYDGFVHKFYLLANGFGWTPAEGVSLASYQLEVRERHLPAKYEEGIDVQTQWE